MIARTRLAAVALGLASLLAVSACHVGLSSNDAKKASNGANAQTAVTDKSGAKATLLTPEAVAPNGTARIDGSTRGSLTAGAAVAYNSSGSVADVSVADRGAQAAFGELCRGGIDMVDSARSISASELNLCSRYGLQVVQLQFASDAVVLSTKSGTDVGGDCLTMNQVNNIYRAGSPVTNWSQLGFDNVPVRVGGPDRSNNAFDFFGRSVLDAPEPSMTYLRSDYRAFSDDSGTRKFIVGDAQDQQNSQLASHYEALVISRKGVVAQAVTNLASAKANLFAARQNRSQGITDGRPQHTQNADQARLDAARSAEQVTKNELAHQRQLLKALEKPAKSTDRAESAIAALRGRVAYFRFTYYELFEDDLRPFEISTTAKPRNCVFPSEATITSGEYPLSRRLLLTTTTRSLARHEVSDFLLKYLGAAQQDAITARLLPIPDSVVAQQRTWLLGTALPRIVTPSDLSAQPVTPESAQ
ncbi:MAG: phosphate transporter substrate-binding protein PhoT family [Marmoricola sp.]|nr:phosphate transporter substrate-binding protein PhoT family [Marmoricola sp.]